MPLSTTAPPLWQHSLRHDYAQPFKKRFVTRIRERIITFDTNQAAFAWAEDKAVYLHSYDGKNHLVDYTLNQLESLLDPNDFFRLNGSYRARFEAVQSILAWSNSRLKVRLHQWPDNDIILCRGKTRTFRAWTDW
jgi:DNA-binding LytR/AlgR family response regulator